MTAFNVCARHFKGHSSPGIQWWHCTNMIFNMFSSWTRWSILPFQSLQYDGGNTWCEYGTLLSFRLFTDFASVEIVYSFCILWQCKKSNFQKGQFSISPLRRRLCTRNNIPRIYGPQIALCTFLILQRSAHLILATTITTAGCVKIISRVWIFAIGGIFCREFSKFQV